MLKFIIAMLFQLVGLAIMTISWDESWRGLHVIGWLTVVISGCFMVNHLINAYHEGHAEIPPPSNGHPHS